MLMMATVTKKANGNGISESPEEKPSKSPFPALPRPRSKTGMTIEETLDYWRTLHTNFPGRVSGYLFRLFPIVNRPEKQHNIALYVEPPPDKEWVLQTWGTGTYRFLLKDGDTKSELVTCNFKFQESYGQHPPVLDYLELDRGHKDNRSYIDWLRSKGFLKMPGDEQTGSSAAEHTAVKALADIATKKMEPVESIEGEAATAGFKIMQTATEAAIKTVQAQSDISPILKIVEAVKGKDSGNTELVALIVKIQADAAAQQAANMKMIFEIINKPQPQVNPLDQLKAIGEIVKTFQQPKSENPGMSHVREIAETVNVLKDVFGGGRQGKPEWYETVLGNEDVLNVAKTVAGGFWNWSTAMLNNRGQAQPGAVAVQPQPDAPPIITPPPNPANPPSEEAMNIAALQQFLLPRFAAFMEALDGGQTGSEFAQELFETRPSLGGMTLGTHAQIKAIGRDKILSLLAMAPAEVKNLLAGKQTLLFQFLDDFLAWEPAKEEDEVPPPPGA